MFERNIHTRLRFVLVRTTNVALSNEGDAMSLDDRFLRAVRGACPAELAGKKAVNSELFP
jgi:hypothetical protein